MTEALGSISSRDILIAKSNITLFTELPTHFYSRISVNANTLSGLQKCCVGRIRDPEVSVCPIDSADREEGRRQGLL